MKVINTVCNLIIYILEVIVIFACLVNILHLLYGDNMLTAEYTQTPELYITILVISGIIPTVPHIIAKHTNGR